MESDNCIRREISIGEDFASYRVEKFTGPLAAPSFITIIPLLFQKKKKKKENKKSMPVHQASKLRMHV